MNRRPHVLFAAYVLCATAALTWPVLAWVGADIEPLILGLPPTLAWHVLWVLLGFTALFLYERAVHGSGDPE